MDMDRLPYPFVTIKLYTMLCRQQLEEVSLQGFLLERL